MHRARKALRWMLNLLERHESPYVIIGGAAAKAYGVGRELADIDLYVPRDKMELVVPELEPYVYWGPEWYEDEWWRLYYLKLEYVGQNIDLGDGDSLQIGKIADGNLVVDGIDFSSFDERELLGEKVRVMPKQQLVAYKQFLDRAVDRVDVEEMA